MSTWIIPITRAADLGAFRFSADLEGKDYQFEFQFNGRENYWYFNLLDSESVDIKGGIKAIINYPLLLTLVSETRPPGELIFLDTRETNVQPAQDPGLDELGTDVILIYIDSA